VILDIVARERLTSRQLLRRLAGARGHWVTAGTPEQIADRIQTWFEQSAADGFNVMPPQLPHSFDAFAQHVVPILQRRGLFRTEYSGRTLSDSRDRRARSRQAATLFSSTSCPLRDRVCAPFDRADRQLTVYQRNRGQMSDIVDKITGKAKQAVGDVVGDRSLHREGRKEERKGDAKEEAARAQDRADEKANEVANLERETH